MYIDLTLLARFEATHRLGSFSKAADEMGLTHSALTKSIQTLENHLNVRLFERTTRTVRPTEAGRRLALSAPDLLQLAQNVATDVRAGDRQLKIICGPAVMDTFIHGALARFRKDFPEVSVSVEILPPELAYDHLIRLSAHLLLYHSTTVAGMGKGKGLRVHPLLGEPYVIVMSPSHPALATNRSVTALLAYDWAIAGFDPRFQAGLPEEMRNLLRRNQFPKYRVLNQSACIELALTADVMTIVPASTAKPYVADGRLHALPLPGDAQFSISAVTTGTAAQPPTVLGFIEAAKDYLARLVEL